MNGAGIEIGGLHRVDQSVEPNAMADLADEGRLAQSFVDDDWAQVLDRCRSDRRLAEGVSRAATQLLLERALLQEPGADPDTAVWHRLQRPVLEFASVQGADQAWMADRLFNACIRERSAFSRTLDVDVVAWMVDQIPELVRALLAPGPARAALNQGSWGIVEYPITRALWKLPDALGLDWFLIRLEQDDSGVARTS
jgi:hypothetical protein